MFGQIPEMGNAIQNNYRRGENCEKRTEISYQRDAKAPTKEKRNNVKKNSSFLFSRVSLDRVVPASLHIMMGAVQKYGFNYCLDASRESDNDTGLPLLKTNYKTERAAKASVLEVETELTVVETDLESLAVIEKVLERFETKSVVPSAFQEDLCDAEFCLFKDKLFSKFKRFDARRETCAECLENFHAVCLGIWDTFSWNLTGSIGEVFRCHRCCGKTGDKVLKMARKKKANVENERGSLIANLSTENASALHCEQFKHFRILAHRACWKKLGAHMSAYMQTFCGNHCVELLEPRAVEQYLAVLQQSVDIPHVKGFLVAFGQFQKLCVARSLTGDEKEQMENAIDTIWTSLRRYAGKETVTPKMHVLLEHVTEFVNRYGTLGKMSEQGIESLHKHVNLLKRGLGSAEIARRLQISSSTVRILRRHFAGGPFILQQDWAPSHGSRSTLAVLEAHFPGFLDKNLWPASSPDLNPMDFSVWGMLEGKIAGKVFATVDDLKAALEVAWASIDDGYLRRTVNSAPIMLEWPTDNDPSRVNNKGPILSGSRIFGSQTLWVRWIFGYGYSLGTKFGYGFFGYDGSLGTVSLGTMDLWVRLLFGY
uniref:Uncharacterized protein n=2 Tax=Caenorhabditis japonica TaxID=281687 RepID=A0A8R1EVG6_CAEJA